jgi:hypothetical protein
MAWSRMASLKLDEVLKERIAGLKAVRDAAQAAPHRLRSDGRATIRLGPRVIAEFAQKMREQITSGDMAFRKAHLGAIVDRIEVDDRELRISGRKEVLEQAVIASGGKPHRGSHFCSEVAGELGFEPRLTESESAVLPLNYSPKLFHFNNLDPWLCKLVSV